MPHSLQLTVTTACNLSNIIVIAVLNNFANSLFMLTDSVCLLSHRREIVTQRRDFILKRLLLWKTALDLSNSKLASGEL